MRLGLLWMVGLASMAACGTSDLSQRDSGTDLPIAQLDLSSTTDGTTDGTTDAQPAGSDLAVPPAKAVTCGQGLTCNGQPFCGAFDGFNFIACDCDETQHLTCSEPVPGVVCPTDLSQLTCDTPAPQNSPRVLCGENGGSGCTMRACTGTHNGVTTGWSGICEVSSTKCPQPLLALLGTACAPGASNCTCAKSALDPQPVTCNCVPIGNGMSVWL